jgi:SRSO17 transposase
LALRLYLPAGWTDAPDRLEQARVPPDERALTTKWQIALDLLDEVRVEELPHAVVVADASDGVATDSTSVGSPPSLGSSATRWC